MTSSATAETVFGYPKWPAFRLGEAKYPQETYVGRWLQFMDVIDPTVLFTSDAKLKECCTLLDRFKEGKSTGVSDRELWTAQKVKSSIVHPDTGEKIFFAFRMSGFVPCGFPTVVGLLLPNQTFATMIFWQWLNQSHNACVNYANRNASKPTPMSRFATGYAGAVGSAVGISVVLKALVNRTQNVSANMKFMIQRFIPLPAVALASSMNVLLMRLPELSTGIDVFDSKENKIGTSKAAAKQALRDTTLTRAFLPVPILLFPPIFMLALERQSWFSRLCARNKRVHLAANALSVIVVFWAALPAAIAIFPQKSSIGVADLEPELAALTSESRVYFNKGL